MGTRLIPAVDWPIEKRIQARVPYHLWYVPRFPVSSIGGKLDKEIEERPWLLGLLRDIERTGHLRNPLIIWNHHPNRLTGKQPEWLLRAGSNRMWCVEQLGWKYVPAVVSTVGAEIPPSDGVREVLEPKDVQPLFEDGGRIWVNEHGFGLQAAKAPEVTYADYDPTEADKAALKPTDHKRSKIIAPWQ
jgi:hypothetical protein